MGKICIIAIIGIVLTGCAVKPVIIKDSDKVYVGKAGQQPPTPDFDWALLSQEKLRELTE
jgi:hypothetical protein